MKKTMVFLTWIVALAFLACCAFCALSGCSGDKGGVSTMTPGPSMEVVVGEPFGATEVDLAKTVPDPYVLFAEKEFKYYTVADTVDKHSFMLGGVTIEMYQEYKQACRGEGWTDVRTELDDLYVATAQDGAYRLELVLFDEDPEDMSMSVGVYRVEGK